MLVFRDAILGFVASIQLAANNMVKPGDWITMSKFNVDGTIHDISLTTVKVQNWDKTITTIPTYSLVSEPVVNWSGMVESGGRRIQRIVQMLLPNSFYQGYPFFAYTLASVCVSYLPLFL